MPKYCSVPNCKNDFNGHPRKSFYKFPLQDPERLQQWVKNMGRENWTPSRYQYICNEHFAPSCFKLRWGIRYLDNDAVPTIFQETEKRKATDLNEKKPKRLRSNKNQTVTESGDQTAAEAVSQTMHLYEIPSADLAQPESQAGESDYSSHPGSLAVVDGGETSVTLPLTLYQTFDDLSSCNEDTQVVLTSGNPTEDGQQEPITELTTAILRRGNRLVFRCMDNMMDFNENQELCDVHDHQEENEPQVFAYFETVPNVLKGEKCFHYTFSPDIVMSSALSSKPISSTLPIVSKHTPPSPASLVLTLERLDHDGEESLSEVEDGEQQSHQLVEHCYHKNSLSKEQLEAIVIELQKKVKVLQQRHRRHLEKLIGLENTVSQLRKNNLLNEERLQLLERVYIQSSTAASDVGETVTIVYDEDNTAYLYTPLTDTQTLL